MTARVCHSGAVPAGAGAERPVMPPLPGSELTAALLELPSGASSTPDTTGRDVVLYTLDGEGTLAYPDGHDEPLRPGTAALVLDGEAATLTARPHGLRAIRLGAGPGCDLHAPLGGRERVTRLDLGRSEGATSSRSFQVLFDMGNGCHRATVFVGVVPPGRAPWHFHQYDEIVWILDGHGLYRLAGGVEEFQPGSAFRVRPREVHVVENSGPSDLLLLGMFTPAGSPAAAYLAEAPSHE
jgi:quercetin dioxygenase-like cupin family protein